MDYYKAVVGHIGIDPEYFWYRMSEQEVAALCEVVAEQSKKEWEHTRIVAYYAASGMNKMPRINKFMPFPWDSEAEQKTMIKPSKERMDALMNIINNGNKL